MKVPLSLLKQYVNLEKLTVAEIAETLTLLGIEVDAIENEKPLFSNVVAAKVEATEPHPNADKLTIARVFDGSDFYKIVCGAKNCRPGIITAFAKIGAVLTEDGKKIEIKKAKLREVESFGMLCSKPELGLGEGDGILELPANTKLGLDLSTLVSPILEVSLTPNLGHCMSIVGIARELAAYLNEKVKYPPVEYFPDRAFSLDLKIKIEKGALRYSALAIKNISVAPSPSWLTEALEASGIRSVSNIVDVLNFVMIEMGQPMHSFDLDKIEKEICAGTLKKDETFIGLDSIERKLPKDSLVIKDKEKVLAVAGIMGGQSSAVTDGTTSILLESACFDPIQVRKTSKSISLRTESSLRYEKATDPNNTIKALGRAAHLIQQICPDCKISSTIDVKETEFKPRKISLRFSRANKILGTTLSPNEIEMIFKRLECLVSRLDSSIEVEVPTYRNDLRTEIDLIEDVARIYGYNNIERKPPSFSSSSIGHSPLYLFENKLKTIFSSLGMQEIITSDLISAKMAEVLVEKSLPKNALIEVLYSKSEDKSHLRPSLLPSFLEIAKHNFDHKNFDFSAFEISKIHLKKDLDFIEEPTFALMLTGKTRPHHFDIKPQDFDFYDMKGIIENLFDALKIESFHFAKSSHPMFHPGRQAKVFLRGLEIGVAGEVHPSILLEFDIKKPILFAEISTLLLLKNQNTNIKYSPLPQFPSSERDWTVSVEGEVSIPALLEKISSPILESAYILDIYADPKKENIKNITIHFIYRDKNKTVSFEEVEKEQEKITSKLFKTIKELEKRSPNN